MFAPLSVKLPAPALVKPPLPLIAPEIVPADPLFAVSVFAPSMIVPVPVSWLTVVPPVRPAMLKLALLVTPTELRMEPVPDSDSVPPEIVVAPV